MISNRTRRQRQIAEVRPAAAAERDYARKLRRAVEAMAISVQYWVEAKYRRALVSGQTAGAIPDPEAAQDSTPLGDWRALERELADLRNRWTAHFVKQAARWAADAVDGAYKANRAAWQTRAAKEGFDVPMKLSAAQRTILAATVSNNVALIKSIPEQYFQRIEGDVTRGYLAGRDLESIAAALRKTGHSTVKRAALIARDQSNKLTAHMNAARQQELGVRYAYWKHSTVEKDPRPNHLRASREGWIFDTQVGIDFNDGFGLSLPGTPISCRCGSRGILPAIDDPITPEDLVPVPGFAGAFTRRSNTDDTKKRGSTGRVARR